MGADIESSARIMNQVDWLNILIECKNKIQKQIKAASKTLKSPQPNLGIGAGGDPIKKVDLAAENAITSTFRKHKLSFTLVSEESGIEEYGDFPHKHFVTADPIDGTTNLIRGIPFFATSIAVSTKPSIETVHAAMVVDLSRDIAYTAQKGKGAYRNNQRIAPSKETSLKEAVVGIDLKSYKVQEVALQLTNLIRETSHIRHLGANALELCYVADGTIDAFIDIRGKLRTTDIAAAWLILQEAHAIMSTPEGDPLKVTLSPKQTVKFVASANKEIHQAILELIRKE